MFLYLGTYTNNTKFYQLLWNYIYSKEDRFNIFFFYILLHKSISEKKLPEFDYCIRFVDNKIPANTRTYRYIIQVESYYVRFYTDARHNIVFVIIL